MAKKKQVNISKKDIIFGVLIVVNLVATGVLGYLVFRLGDNLTTSAITQTRSGLVQHAKIECMKETGGTDCDYVELNQRLLDEYIESVNTK